MTPRDANVTSVRVTLRLHPQKDEDLIRWLNAQEPGMRNQRIKEALRRGLGMEAERSASEVDLGEIRAVVEAAVESALARWGGLALSPRKVETVEDETERTLDGMMQTLML